MTILRTRSKTCLALVLAAAGLVIGDGVRFAGGALAQSDDERKGKGREEKARERPPERRPSSPPPSGPQQTQPATPQMKKVEPPPSERRRVSPPSGPQQTQPATPQYKKAEPPPSMKTPPEQGTKLKREGPAIGGKPGEPRDSGPAAKKLAPLQEPKKEDVQRAPAAKGPLPGERSVPFDAARPKRFEDVQKGRRETVEEGGRRKVIQEPGNRFIVKQDNKAIIRHDESELFRRKAGAKTVQRTDGTKETYYLRKDGTRVVTIVDDRGRLLRRYRRDRDGREHDLIDNRRFYRNLGIGVGIGVGGIIALNLAMPRITIPRERYIVEYEDASDDDLYDALIAPPVEDLERAYALDEVRYSYELRARMPRIDLDTITFDSGAWEVPPEQYFKLERMARAILRLLERNPDSVVLVEGHTDAVGSDDDNLSLSDRRASAVADILIEQFGVPPENLVTQGYGEQYLKVNMQGPERLNRRVTIVNITRLMSQR